MINRGKLRRDVEKGLFEGKVGFDISHDGERPDRFSKETDKWGTARVSKGFNDFQEGKMNLWEHSFKSKSGHAYEKDGVINFGGHSNENILLRRRK